ncbi:transmembrane protein 50A [Macrosteles quadrilineatus]|uniref:transmembrane protein 50A n=1 Tax=Macrosteles quadrilineatus TaxID=74068 RepID=UPI0023E110A8|nr:transmembrane protein 50A [Macrosteles quadrilineatus]
MASCLENLPPCIWFEGGDKRNALSSMLAGFLFFSGWWFMIDANAKYPSSIDGLYHVWGIVGTISLFMINMVSNAQVRGDAYSGGCVGPRGARVWLFIGFVLGFVPIIAACWILMKDFVSSSGKPFWAGSGLFLQNVFIFGGSLVYKFGRTEDQWG